LRGVVEAMRRFSNLLRDERAATAVEYGLIIAMIVLAMIGALNFLASTTTTMWNNVSTTVSGVM
jgi:pilus assembly protein Flp/PilA